VVLNNRYTDGSLRRHPDWGRPSELHGGARRRSARSGFARSTRSRRRPGRWGPRLHQHAAARCA
jgi:hypothetical protein